MPGTLTVAAMCTAMSHQPYYFHLYPLEDKVKMVALPTLKALAIAAPIDYMLSDFVPPYIAAALASSSIIFYYEGSERLSKPSIAIPTFLLASTTALVNKKVTLLTGFAAVLACGTLVINSENRIPTKAQALSNCIKLIVVVSGAMSILAHLFED